MNLLFAKITEIIRTNFESYTVCHLKLVFFSNQTGYVAIAE